MATNGYGGTRNNPMAHGYVARVATTWVPMGARVSVLSPNDDPNPPKSWQKVFGKSKNSIAFGKSTSQRIYPEQHTPKMGKNYINMG